MNTLTRHSLGFLLLLCLLPEGVAQEWTRFRGPNGTGISPAKTIPTTWTDKDFNWKLPLPAVGHSSPVVWGDKVFFTTGDDQTKQVSVYGVHAVDGQVLWQKSFPIAPHHKNSYNTFASGSPAVDQHRVYVCWSSPAHYTLMALTHDGRTVWERDLGPFASQHGGSASPIVYEDKVVLGKEQDGESFLIAVDAATGKTRWQTPRKSLETTYVTPCVYQPQEGPPVFIFSSHAEGVTAIDPGDGKVLWELGDVFDKRVVSSPIMAAGLIIGTCGSGGGGNYLSAVRPGSAAKKLEVVYTIKKSAPYVPTSVCVGERLFLWSDGGIVSCVQASSGEVKWQERVGGNYFSSPLWVDGRLFCVSTKGEVVVVEASDRFQLLARNPLGEVTHSTPAVAGGRMYIHTTKSLISVGGQLRPAR
ncbi:MAG: PQQ-binding-like beta-propeller repeat protein [Verrucomicrobia bacterium]|nr:PQQ-binding-like beta-propeller repeat protein [Verrucomicrobiota bacterium]